MKAIIFDFDGVLADTYDFNKGLSEKVMHHEISHEDFKAHHDGNVFEKPRIAFTPKSAEQFHLEYLNGIKNIKPFFSLKNIKLLKEKYQLYIISSSREDSINKFLNHHKLEYFKDVLGVNFHKLKIKKFKYLLEKYKLKPNEIIFVSDTLGDILEAKEVNIKTIAVDFGFHEKERLEIGSPFKIVSNFEEMLKIIESV